MIGIHPFIFDNNDEMVDGDLAHLGFHSAAAHLRPQPTSFSRDQPFGEIII